MKVVRKHTTMSKTDDSRALIRALENRRVNLQGQLATAERDMDWERATYLEDELISIADQKRRHEKSSAG